MGSPAIASVGVSVWARTSAFDRGIRRSRKQLKIFRKNIVEASQKIVRFGAVVTGVAGGALVQLVRSSARTIDSIAKTADKLGLSTEALAGLQHAAELSGVAVRTFDMGLQRMTRRVAEAAVGTGEAQAAIKELSLDAQELGRMTVDQQFIAIAEAMEKVTSQSDRVRLGFKLFDSEGVALINTLRGGKEAIEAMQKRAAILGLTFSRDQARGVEKANDAMKDLWASVKGLGNAMTFKFAKSIEVATKRLTAFIVWIREAKSSFSHFVIEFGKLALQTVAFVTAMSALVLIGNTVIRLFGMLAKAYHALSKAVIIFNSFAGPKGWAVLAGAAVAATVAIVAADAAYAGLTSEMEELDKASRDAAAGMVAVNEQADEAAKKLKAVEAIRRGRQARADAARGREEAFGAQAAQIRLDLRTPGEVLTNEVDKLLMLYRRGVMDIATYDRAMASANKNFEDASGITALADAAKAAAEDMKRTGESITQSMRTPLEVFRDRMEEIRQVFLAGELTFDTYKRAVEAASKTLEDSRGGGGAASFREVDLSRVSIGPGNRRNSKAQLVKDPETKKIVELIAKQTEVIKNQGKGLG